MGNLLDMGDQHASTFSNPGTFPTPSLNDIEAIMRNFADRMPAPLAELRVHPAYLPVFLANLREEGVVEASGGRLPLASVPIITDDTVPFGRVKMVYRGDNGV